MTPSTCGARSGHTIRMTLSAWTSTYPGQAKKWNPEAWLKCGSPRLERSEPGSNSPRAIGKHWVNGRLCCVAVTARVGPLFLIRHSNLLSEPDRGAFDQWATSV